MNDYFDNYDSTEKNLEYLMHNHGEIYEAYENYGRLVHEKGGPLDEKTRWLIKVALSACCQYENALITHILKAQKSGCTKEEIEHAILLVAPTSGFPKMMHGLLLLRDTLEADPVS
ncbi:MAG: Carboxymuconolactone decarboxylase family protein [Firmicutes bacterium ADurb.Bin182]|nr:MAG: Carboxymuconolactone decarboxylase family protein [Firmicutes bacterium ADurb.Bin182]